MAALTPYHKLKPAPEDFKLTATNGLRSDRLHGTVPKIEGIRDYFLGEVQKGDESIVPGPVISSSEFVPRNFVEHLMRDKTDTACGVKFGVKSRGIPDSITNMEGAMHSLVTPVVGRCEMEGDYRFLSGHGVTPILVDEAKNLKMTRSVVLSASIQPDFELTTVMLRMCCIEEKSITGNDLGPGPWDILNVMDKQDDGKRESYDLALKRHMIYHLTSRRLLPSVANAKNKLLTHEAMSLLNTLIVGSEDAAPQITETFLILQNGSIVSLEMLFSLAYHQVRNELSALEVMCSQGYVYTYDPASIFAVKIGPRILNRLMLLGLQHLSNNNIFRNMKIFAFNDYSEQNILPLVRAALRANQDVQVMQKEMLFKGPGGRYRVDDYPAAEGAMLVVHNNSDGFGQNIEFESSSGSLDGAVGTHSSAAASLERKRKDLLDLLM